jgi:hypothetical protein
MLIMPPLPRVASARLAVHVDKIKETSPSFRGVCWEQLAIARADGGARCKCAVYKHLFKTDAKGLSMQRSNQFKPGHNIKGGRPRGSRNKLAQQVFDDIFRHWCEPAGGELSKGQAALELLYRERPGEYLRLTASVLPKEFVFESAVTELDDEELDRMIEMLRERALSARKEQTLELKPVPKALLNGRH